MYFKLINKNKELLFSILIGMILIIIIRIIIKEIIYLIKH